MAEAEFDFYDALNLQRGASADDVRAAFRDLSREYHPDKRRGESGRGSAAEEAFMRVHRAYRVLGDETLRTFYDRYGAPGVRLAEALSDGEEDAGGAALSVPEDRLRDVEARVARAMRRRSELRTQRLLGLSGSFTLSVGAAPGPYAAHFRRRYRLQYSATSQSVQIAVCEGLKMSVGCVSHIQGANGAGVAKVTVAAQAPVGQHTNVRAAVTVAGAAPEAEASMTRTLSPNLVVQQRASASGDGASMSLTVLPWLSSTLRGSMSWSMGEDSSLSIGLVQRSSCSGHSARAYVSLRPQGSELAGQLKYKPCRAWSLRLAPSLSARGLAVQAICTQTVGDGLSKLQWALRARRAGLTLRLSLKRSGLRFTLPLELWPEALGPVPLPELGLALALWALPPLCVRAAAALGDAARGALGRARGEGRPAAPAAAAAGPAAAAAGGEASAASAAGQRLLVAPEAARRRAEEAACRGLEILAGWYGDPGLAGLELPSGRAIDVTDCLMAKVRRSQLHISEVSKSTLLGFHRPCGGEGADPVLRVRYRFGGVEHEQTFGDLEPVLLP